MFRWRDVLCACLLVAAKTLHPARPSLTATLYQRVLRAPCSRRPPMEASTARAHTWPPALAPTSTERGTLPAYRSVVCRPCLRLQPHPIVDHIGRRVSTDGAATWTKAASATPENPTVMFGYSSLTLLPAGARSSMLSGSVRVGVGLTYETEGASCTVDTSACRIMYRNFSFPARLLGY